MCGREMRRTEENQIRIFSQSWNSGDTHPVASTIRDLKQLFNYPEFLDVLMQKMGVIIFASKNCYKENIGYMLCLYEALNAKSHYKYFLLLII